MALRSFNVGLNPTDLNLERLDPCVKLLDRQWIEVLSCKLD